MDVQERSPPSGRLAGGVGRVVGEIKGVSSDGVESNIKLFYVYIFLNRLELWLPTVALFLLDRGFSLTQYATVDAIWYVSTLVFEIPTGVITDRYGKKVSLLIAALSLSLSLFILALGGSFLSMVIAYVLWGFASSFESGTYDALIYDTLKQIDREEDYRKVMGQAKTLTILAGALGSAAAGWLGSIRLGLPIILTAAIALLLCPLVLLFKEPDVAQVREPSHLLHVKESIKYVCHHRSIALLIVYSAILETAVWGLYIFYQPLLHSLGIPVVGTGFVYFLFRLFGAGGAYLSDALYRVVGKVSIYFIPLCFVACVFSMGYAVSPWVLSFIFVIFFIEGSSYPILNDLLNKNLPSGKRATIISLGAVLACLMGTLVYPALGRIADASSLQTTFKMLGVGVLVSMSLVLVLLRKESL